MCVCTTIHYMPDRVKAQSAWGVFRRDCAQAQAAGQEESRAPRLRCPASNIGGSPGRTRTLARPVSTRWGRIQSGNCRSFRKASRACLRASLTDQNQVILPAGSGIRQHRKGLAWFVCIKSLVNAESPSPCLVSEREDHRAGPGSNRLLLTPPASQCMIPGGGRGSLVFGPSWENEVENDGA